MQLELTQQMLNLRQGDHLCLFYDRDPAEQMPALVPFIQQGLSSDEQCIYIADDQTVDELAGQLERCGINVGAETDRGALKLWTRREWRQPGELDSEKKAAQVVSDGEEAVAYLEGADRYSDRQKHPMPIVIFLDLNMTKKNGFEVLQWLRQQPGLKRIIVNILSASSRDEDVERAFDYGANAYIVKPSKVDALIEMLKAWHSLAQFNAFPALE